MNGLSQTLLVQTPPRQESGSLSPEKQQREESSFASSDANSTQMDVINTTTANVFAYLAAQTSNPISATLAVHSITKSPVKSLQTNPGLAASPVFVEGSPKREGTTKEAEARRTTTRICLFPQHPLTPKLAEFNAAVSSQTGITMDEFLVLSKFYKEHSLELREQNQQKNSLLEYYGRCKTFTKRIDGELQTQTIEGLNLTRPVLYFSLPGANEGLYVRLKGEIGRGASKRLALYYHLESGQLRTLASYNASYKRSTEIKILNDLRDNPYILGGYEVTYKGLYRSRDRDPNTKENRVSKEERELILKVGLFMEFCAVGDLRSYAKRVDYKMSEAEVLHIAIDCAKALAAIHSLEMIHGDVKESNIMLTGEGYGKLGDFGLVCPKNKKHSDGTISYMAPEQLENLATLQNYADWTTLTKEEKRDFIERRFKPISEKADVWAYGWMLMRIAGTPPMEANPKVDDRERCSKSGLEKIKLHYLKQRANKKHIHYILNECLQINPLDRPSISSLIPRLTEILGGTKRNEFTPPNQSV